MATVEPPPIDRVGPADLVMLAMGTSSVPEQLGGALLLDEAEEFDLGAAQQVLAQRITAILGCASYYVRLRRCAATRSG